MITDRMEAAQTLRDSLEKVGYIVDHCMDKGSARVLLARYHYDMLIDHLGALRLARVKADAPAEARAHRKRRASGGVRRSSSRTS